MSASSRSTSASAPTATVEQPLDRPQCGARSSGQGGRHRRRRHRLHARLEISRARAGGCSALPRDRLRAGLGQPRSLAAGQAGRPRRHHRGRRLSVADPARYVRQVAEELGGATRRMRRPPPDVHDVLRRPDRRRSLPGQGCDAVRPGRRRRRHGRDRASSPASTRSSASTWAAPRPTSPHYDGDYERAFDTEVAGVRVRAPMMRIHTVAAGGGSILHFEPAASASARIRPAPIPALPATGAAARSPSPTPM